MRTAGFKRWRNKPKAKKHKNEDSVTVCGNLESRQYEKANSFLEKQFNAEKKAQKTSVSLQTPADNEEYLKDFEIGQRVKHKKFGIGTVSKILGDGMNKTLEIIFDDFGMKRLIIAYAKLQNP